MLIWRMISVSLRICVPYHENFMLMQLSRTLVSLIILKLKNQQIISNSALCEVKLTEALCLGNSNYV